MAIHVQKDVRRDLKKRVTLADGSKGFTTEPDGYELADIEVVVDLPSIARRLGLKALANKSGRARYLDGDVIVNVVRRTRFPESR